MLKAAFDGALLWGCGLGLVGVALVLFAHGLTRVPARVCAAVRRYGLSAVLVFGGFAAVATISAQKAGNVTTDLHGLSRIEGEKPTASKNPVEETPCLPSSAFSRPLVRPSGSPSAKVPSETLCVSSAHVFSDSNQTPGYALSRVGTNEGFSFVPPEEAVIAENWRRRGAATDWKRLSFDGWEFPFGGSTFSNMVVFADGTILLSTNAALRPVTASLGLVPAANWPRIFTNLRESVSIRDNPWSRPFSSIFWHCLTPSNTLQLTWRDALLHRSPTNPVSFQVELNPNGNFAYRYDFSALASDDLLTNVFAAVVAEEGKGKKEEGRSAEGQTSFLLSRETTSLIFRSDNERRCDDAREAFEEALGGLDPLACPSGSTNTVWEHLVYTGTTNGAFAYPQSTERTAVLRVAVAGTGRGELLVGSRAVPLVGLNVATTDSHGLARIERSMPAALNTEESETGRHGEIVEGVVGSSNASTSVLSSEESPCLPTSIPSVLSAAGSTPPTLLLPVPRGQTVPLYVRASGSLAVSLSSADFAFGRLPDLAAHRPTGRINFPNVSATVPCFHDYRARQKEVTLPVGAGASALTCTWAASGAVTVESRPPRAALLTGSFDGRTTTPVSYTLAHPDYLFGQTTYAQTARFCPPPPEDVDEDGGRYGGVSVDDERESCWHCLWDLCSRDGTCCGNCRHSDADEDRGPDEPSEEEEVPQPGDYEAAVTNWPHLSGVLKIREPLLYTPPIRLEVPDGAAPRCCPCPGHATNWVAVVYQSDRLKIVDANGLDFKSATETVDVRLAGVRPSRAVGDAFVSFATNGTVCLDGAYTVLGVGVRKPGVDLAALDALNDDFGLPVPVATNAAEAAELELVTAVGLDGGNVRVGFEEASAPFALWVWSPSSNAYRPLASSDGGPLDVSLAAWRRLVGGATDAETSRTRVFVTASAPGAATLAFRYWGVFGGRFVEDVARQRLTAVNPPVMADFNRDGRIDEADVAAWLAGQPFCYWFNGDTFKGDYIGASADGSRNADDLRVNGTFDLVNLFPVALDFSAFRSAWGRHATCVVRPVSADSFNYCLADVPWSEAGSVQTAPRVTLDGDALATAPLVALPPEGRAFAHADFSRLSPKSGVMLCEATRAGVSLVAEVRVGDRVVYSHVLPMDIRSVRDMYRFYSLRGAEGFARGAFGLPSRPWVTPLPDERDLDVFFMHGFNVDEADARSWGDVLFKRLWLAGSRARFSMVTWNGNHHWTGDWANGLHYHQDVCHALKTGDALRRLVEREQPDPSRRVLMAQSLGNMVACEALKQGLRVGKYFMFNAAVAGEAVDGTLQDAGQGVRERYVPEEWRTYDPRAWAANWHRWFADAPEDARARLGWVDRYSDALGNADEVCSYYSTGDEVFHETPNPPWLLEGMLDSTASYAWQKQETSKGGRFVAGTAHGGWGFHTWRIAGFDYRYTAAEAAEMVADGSVTNSPVFNRGYGPMLSPDVAEDEVMYALAKYVPAVSSPVGGSPIMGRRVENHNLNEAFDYRNGWGRVENDAMTWKHSDMKDMAYFYVWPLFEELVTEKGDLK